MSYPGLSAFEIEILGLQQLAGSKSPGWEDNPKDLVLNVTSDCFNRAEGRREVTYQLQTHSGQAPRGRYTVWEQHTDLSITPGAPGQSSDGPNRFDD